MAGAHTASGAALLANDPHLGLVAPAHWYLAAVSTPEGIVMGATLPALPVVVIGRNEQIAGASPTPPATPTISSSSASTRPTRAAT
ncbi:MAG: penicillin acylase family protein [Geminicoccaceae bacterium]